MCQFMMKTNQKHDQIHDQTHDQVRDQFHGQYYERGLITLQIGLGSSPGPCSL